MITHENFEKVLKQADLADGEDDGKISLAAIPELIYPNIGGYSRSRMINADFHIQSMNPRRQQTMQVSTVENFLDRKIKSGEYSWK